MSLPPEEYEEYMMFAKPSSLSRMNEWLRENAPDCGDNSCLFGGRGKGGMRTNGGCRCFKELPTAKRIFVERLFFALSEKPRTIESAPKDEHGIIAFSPTFYQGRGGWVAAVWHKDAWHSNPGGWRFEPTHWLPMPEIPK